MSKLVRDKILDLIKASGTLPQSHIADEEEYKSRLNEKLKEEVSEFIESQTKEELADILEVISAIIEAHNFNRNKIEEIRIKKADERGSFKKRIILD